MKPILTFILLSFFSFSFSQKLEINKNASKNETVLKVTLPEDYTLNFYKNNSLVKSEQFSGVKFFKIEQFQSYDFLHKNHPELRIFGLYFTDELENFKADRIIDFREEIDD